MSTTSWPPWKSLAPTTPPMAPAPNTTKRMPDVAMVPGGRRHGRVTRGDRGRGKLWSWRRTPRGSPHGDGRRPARAGPLARRPGGPVAVATARHGGRAVPQGPGPRRPPLARGARATRAPVTRPGAGLLPSRQRHPPRARRPSGDGHRWPGRPPAAVPPPAGHGRGGRALQLPGGPDRTPPADGVLRRDDDLRHH